jgi:hypothetical protein
MIYFEELTLIDPKSWVSIVNEGLVAKDRNKLTRSRCRYCNHCENCALLLIICDDDDDVNFGSE